jgi:hypothetical protein
MLVKIEKKYMTVPVNTSASVKNLAIVQDGKTVYDMDCKIDNICPDFTAYMFADRKMFGVDICRKLWGVQGVSWTIRTPEDLKTAEQEGWLPIFEGFIPE